VRRRTWQSQIRQLLQDGGLWAAAAAADAATADGVRGLMGVLLGDEAALVQSASTWLELAAALALHEYPSMRLQPDLEPLLRKSLAGRDGGGVELLIVLEDLLQVVALLPGQEDRDSASDHHSAHNPTLHAVPLYSFPNSKGFFNPCICGIGEWTCARCCPCRQ
jgi:hypothetical protein